VDILRGKKNLRLIELAESDLKPYTGWTYARCSEAFSFRIRTAQKQFHWSFQ